MIPPHPLPPKQIKAPIDFFLKYMLCKFPICLVNIFAYQCASILSLMESDHSTECLWSLYLWLSSVSTIIGKDGCNCGWGNSSFRRKASTPFRQYRKSRLALMKPRRPYSANAPLLVTSASSVTQKIARKTIT